MTINNLFKKEEQTFFSKCTYSFEKKITISKCISKKEQNKILSNLHIYNKLKTLYKQQFGYKAQSPFGKVSQVSFKQIVNMPFNQNNIFEQQTQPFGRQQIKPFGGQQTQPFGGQQTKSFDFGSFCK